MNCQKQSISPPPAHRGGRLCFGLPGRAPAEEKPIADPAVAMQLSEVYLLDLLCSSHGASAHWAVSTTFPQQTAKQKKPDGSRCISIICAKWTFYDSARADKIRPWGSCVFIGLLSDFMGSFLASLKPISFPNDQTLIRNRSRVATQQHTTGHLVKLWTTAGSGEWVWFGLGPFTLCHSWHLFQVAELLTQALTLYQTDQSVAVHTVHTEESSLTLEARQMSQDGGLTVFP